jgi:hypothetical protein
MVVSCPFVISTYIYFSTMSCMILLGSQAPCTANQTSQINLHFLLKHVQFDAGCVSGTLKKQLKYFIYMYV